MNPGNAPSDKVQWYIEDFINRYQQGPQRISEQEATDRYRQVASQLPPDDYLQAAKEAFARMSPEERVQFGRYLGQEAQRQGHDFVDLNQDGIDDRLQDPDFLAQTTSRAHQEQPGLLGQLFGGSGGGGGHAGGGTGGGGSGNGGSCYNVVRVDVYVQDWPYDEPYRYDHSYLRLYPTTCY